MNDTKTVYRTLILLVNFTTCILFFFSVTCQPLRGRRSRHLVQRRRLEWISRVFGRAHSIQNIPM